MVILFPIKKKNIKFSADVSSNSNQPHNGPHTPAKITEAMTDRSSPQNKHIRHTGEQKGNKI